MDQFLAVDNAAIRRWLDHEWNAALAEHDNTPTQQIDARSNEIDALVNSETVSIRYALVTQVLGRIADPTRSTTALQLGASGEGGWDARSFSTAIVVPWVAENQHVLGTSAEPYASKPLRRTRITSDMSNVRDKRQWQQLFKYLTHVESLTPVDLENEFRRILRALGRRLASQKFTYAIPARVSLIQLENLLARFLRESSGGLRPMAVATALLATLGKAFSLFSRVESQGVNEPDAATGMPGDIMCYTDDDKMCLAVEVKDLDLTLSHVRDASRKAKQSPEGLSSFLFAVRGVHESDKKQISAILQRDWASGLNIYTVNIQTLASTSFVLVDEVWRVRFLRQVGTELDERKHQPSRMDWRDVLLALGDGEA